MVLVGFQRGGGGGGSSEPLEPPLATGMQLFNNNYTTKHDVEDIAMTLCSLFTPQTK